jgi:carboxypeptidase family protein
MKQVVISVAIVLGLTLSLPGLEAQATGTITGVVTTKAVGPRPIRVTMDQRVCGNELADEAVVVDATGHLANAVVTLAGVKGGNAPASSGIMNEKCSFSPRVQVVRPNATIITSSKDPILHTTNAMTEGGKNLFNVAVPVPGIKISKPLNTPPGLVRLICNTHPWMRGYIIVTDDMTAVTGADGKFTLSSVPAGTYELRIWHESLKGAAQKITVGGTQPTTVTFELK